MIIHIILKQKRIVWS